MRERSIRALILALVGILALTGALAGSVWFLGHDSQARLAAGLYAEKAAKALAAGTLPEGLQSTDRAALEADYAKVLAGMGKLRPVVKVASVVLDKGERRGTITFDQSWKIHADKAAWTYQSTMPIAAITRAEGVEWVGTWSHEVIAKGLRDEEVLNAVREVAVRGDILDGDQDPLVMPRPVTRVGLLQEATHIGADDDGFCLAIIQHQRGGVEGIPDFGDHTFNAQTIGHTEVWCDVAAGETGT